MRLIRLKVSTSNVWVGLTEGGGLTELTELRGLGDVGGILGILS